MSIVTSWIVIATARVALAQPVFTYALAPAGEAPAEPPRFVRKDLRSGAVDTLETATFQPGDAGRMWTGGSRGARPQVAEDPEGCGADLDFGPLQWIGNPTAFPYRTACKLFMRFRTAGGQDVSFVGSGALRARLPVCSIERRGS